LFLFKSNTNSGEDYVNTATNRWLQLFLPVPGSIGDLWFS
jgi:hypothetical protein